MHSLIKNRSVFALTLVLAALGAGCSRQARTNRHLARADRYFAAEQYPEAEIEYRTALSIQAMNARAIGRLGIIYYEQGRLSKAYQFVLKGAELDPTDSAVHLKAGLVHLLEGKPAEARAEANAILDRDPKNEDAPLLLAQTVRNQADLGVLRERFTALLQQNGDLASLNAGLSTLMRFAGDTPGAERVAKHAVELDPKSSHAHFCLAVVYWMQTNLTGADAEFKTAVDLAPVHSSRRLDYADFKLKTGQVEDARQILTQLTKDAPDVITAWNSLAQISFAQKHYDEAQAYVAQALQRDSSVYESLILSANLRLTKGETDNAISEFDRIATLYPRSPQPRYSLAVAYLTKGDTTKALRSTTDAINLNTNYDEAILLQAQINLRRDNAPAAITSLSQLVQRHPQFAAAQLLLGSAYAAAGNLEEALAVFRRVSTLFPTNAQLPLLVGNILAQKGDKDEARKEFEKSLAFAPGNFSAIEQLVNLDVGDRRYDEAERRIQAEIARQPKSPELQLLLAQVFVARKDVDQAEKTLQQAIALNPNFTAAYLRLAELYRDAKRNDEALARLNQVVAQNPKDATALMFIGMIQNEQQNYAGARDTYEKLLAINPAFSPALNNLAYLYSEKFDQLDKAYDAARKARELLPYDAATADTLGWILYKRGEFTWAVSLLQESAEKLPNEPEVLCHLGMTYYMLADEERAARAFKRALTPNRDFTGKDEVTKRLALLAVDPKTAGPEAIAAVEARVREQSDDPVALARLAAIYERQGALEKAAQTYEQALKQHPKNAGLTLALAMLYADRLHDSARALSLAKDAYKLAPDDPEVSRALGRLALAAGDGKWALSLLQQSEQKLAPQSDALFDLATAYYSVGNLANAESNLRNALQLDPSFPRAKEARQFLDFMTSPATPETLAQARQILQTDPANVPALMVVAAAAERQNDPAAAQTAYEQVLKRYQDFVPAIKRLAILSAEKSGDDKRAYDLAVKARAALPDDPEIARALGMVSYRRGDFRNAVRLLTESSQKTADAATWFYLGMSHSRLKQSQPGKEALQKALAGNLPQSQADEARRTLLELK